MRGGMLFVSSCSRGIFLELVLIGMLSDAAERCVFSVLLPGFTLSGRHCTRVLRLRSRWCEERRSLAQCAGGSVSFVGFPVSQKQLAAFNVVCRLAFG